MQVMAQLYIHRLTGMNCQYRFNMSNHIQNQSKRLPEKLKGKERKSNNDNNKQVK